MVNKKIDIAAAIILNEKKEVLLQKKDSEYKWFPNYWALFGGEIEPGERPNETAKRELLEELEYKVDHLEFFKKYFYRDHSLNGFGTREGYMHIYVCSLDIDTSNLSLNEGAEFGFFPEHKIPQPMINHNFKILKEYFND